ncbi:MAG: hypothetical protein ACOYNY_16190 [Caldilineaceae bacterium]|jgi:hypothetical protein
MDVLSREEVRQATMSQPFETTTDSQTDRAWELHVRAAHGEVLTPAENVVLQEWYAAQEQAEMAMVKLEMPSIDVATLQTQINEMLAQIATATHKIKQLTDENEALRRDIAILRQRLIQQTLLQPA